MRYILLFFLSFPCYATNIVVHKTQDCCDFPSGDTLTGSFTVLGDVITDWAFALDSEFSYPTKGQDDPGFLKQSAEIVSPTHYRFTAQSTPFSTVQIDLIIPSLQHASPVAATVLAAYSQIWFQGTGSVVPEPEAWISLLLGIVILAAYRRKLLGR